ncbi:glycerophosphodiester phosphodiesterase [Lentibacillus cibarius]|uniref:Glycerophosphodiester phosphodiesterase n=1 Tax=Lentibacillus cibarius TaxID=2583219 RepID=A0A549YL92_9BACI|nr:glycerophosphodiester phosphodiesterase [Lentibacillus cibarius]TRM12645.1 glycerophosphodiester phosphodiesterase [Lentibacillus cibarius]
MPTNIFAHRGASGHAPENTMAAFELAYRQGADGIETDVHLTKDNIPVLMHDEQVNRTTNGAGYIKDYSLKQLKQLDAGSWFSSAFADSKILSLDEFLTWIRHKALYLNIELKNNKIDYTNLETIIYNRLAHYGLLHRSILSTFNPNSMMRLKKAETDTETALLISRRFKHKKLITYALDLEASAVHIKYRHLRQRLVDRIHQKQLAVRVFTVNELNHMVRCFSMGCDAIFTDYPEAAVQSRRQFNNRNAR